LRFSPAEAACFLNQVMCLKLSAEEIATLETHTEGWIAGLQLAAISLQGRVNRQEFIQTFSGDNRLVIDFLLDEVLLKQTEDVRRFLLQTSILDSMCGSLCDAVVNLPDERSQINGQDFLENLERANLFIVPLDNQREWYRYHHLFSEALQNRLRKTMDSKLALIHMSASKWFEDEGDYDNALQHALAAGNLDKAALLVEQNALNLLVHSRLTKLKKWYEALPNDKIYSFPELCILRGWLHILIGTVEDANRCVQRTEELLKSASLQDKSTENRIYGYIYGLKARIALRIRDLPKAKEYADQTLDYIIARSPTHSHVAVINGLAAFWEGDLDNADAALQEAISISIECDHRFMTVEASIWLGYIKTIQGRLQQAVGYYKDALEYAELGGGHKIPIAGSAYIGLALVERERNNLGDAENLLMNGFDLCYLFGNPQAWHIAMAHVKRAKGNNYDAIEELRTAERLGVGSEVAFDNLNINVNRVSQWLSPVGGNLNEAKRWANDYRLQLEDFPSFCYGI
jgi:LuxR family maltose regulon positive regulatory protein